MLEVFDANGNEVTGNTAICSRCGAHIKYIFVFERKPYGSTCIEVVSGIRPDNWEWVNGKADEQATRKSLAEKEQAQQEYIARNQTLDEKREGIREVNRIRYAELVNVLNNAQGDFCSEMARNISNDGFSTELYEGILSPRQFQIVREIWGKQTGGRMNSKAYKAAVVEFDQKFHEAE